MTFDRIYIEISNICNLKCTFCPEVLRPKKLLSVDQFELILQKIKPHTKAITMHVMGEPLAHPNFANFLLLNEKYSMPLLLTTNGILLERHKEVLLKSNIIKQINFSVHSFYDNFPNKEIFSYLESIVQFSRIFTQSHPQSFINFRLWNLEESQNSHSIQNKKILSHLSSLFPEAQIPASIEVRKQKSYRLDRHIKLHFDTQFEWPQLNSNHTATNGFCYGLKNQLAILSEGIVVPCCLDKEAVINLGSIFDSDLESILNTNRAQAIIKGFQNGLAIELLCQKCQFKKRFT